MRAVDAAEDEDVEEELFNNPFGALVKNCNMLHNIVGPACIFLKQGFSQTLVCNRARKLSVESFSSIHKCPFIPPTTNSTALHHSSWMAPLLQLNAEWDSRSFNRWKLLTDECLCLQLVGIQARDICRLCAWIFSCCFLLALMQTTIIL